MMKKIVTLSSSLFFFIAIAMAQVKVTTPEAGGFSSSRLAKLDGAMNEWVKKEWMHGGAALIIHDGKIVHYKAVGYNDLATKEVLKKDAIYRIASQTKAIVSVAIMILFEEAKLGITDPVSKYISSYKGQTVLDKFNAADTSYTTVPASREITIKDLLTHTSGIGYAQIGSKEANAIYAKARIFAGLGVTDESLVDAMTRLGKLPLLHQPGAKWTYGLNNDLLGAIVEVVSGVSLDDFLRTRIFEPLGMNDTYFNIPAQKANRLINIYTEDSTGHLVPTDTRMLNGPTMANYPLVKTKYFSGGAGLSSTILDYGIFLQMLLNDGEYNGKRILSRSSVRMMTINQIGDIQFRPEDKFGLGFQIVTEKNGNVPSQPGTFSWGGAFATSYWVDPKERLVLLFYRQLQRTTHGDVVEKFRAMVYAAMN